MHAFRSTLAALVFSGFTVVVLFAADEKKPGEKIRGRLPPGYGKLEMTELQKQATYRIQAEYKAKIKALEERIAELKVEEKAAIAKLLTPVQKTRLKEFEGVQAAVDVKREQAAPANQLTEKEKADGWLLLFDGRTLNGWMTSNEKPSRRPVEDGALNPHKSGHYMLIHEKVWSDFILCCDFKIGKPCNSGIFIRTFPLKPRPGKDVGFNGIEVAIDSSNANGYHVTGAIYDLAKPKRNAMKPPGEWNHIEITCNKNLIEVVLNDEKVTSLDLDQFTEKNKRPDGSAHKFDVVYKDHPRQGYIGFQDHGSNCWFKNVKLKPLN